jgi:CRP/FNR family cyclic AMP-dependent transcriptional regulator
MTNPLSNAFLFAALPDAEKAALDERLVKKAYRKNTVVIEKGDESAFLYLILEGRVKVYIADHSGKEIILNQLGPGKYFGELALLGERPRTASVMTLEDSTFLVMSKVDFKNFLASYPDAAYHLVLDLIRRVAELTDEVRSLALDDVYARVRDLLHKTAVEQQDGTLVVDPMTQQDLANHIGSSREMVSRIFKDLRAGGYIAVKGRRIIINRKLPAQW